MTRSHRVASIATIASVLFSQHSLAALPDKWKTCGDIPNPATVHNGDEAAYVMRQCDSKHLRLNIDTGDSPTLNLTLTSPTFDSEVIVQNNSVLNNIQLSVAADYTRSFRAGPTELLLQNLSHVTIIEATGSGEQIVGIQDIRVQDLAALQELNLLGVAPFGDTQRPSATEHNFNISGVPKLEHLTYYPFSTQDGYVKFPNQSTSVNRKDGLYNWPMTLRGIDSIRDLWIWQDRMSSLEIGGGNNLTVTFSDSTRSFNDQMEPVFAVMKLSGIKTLARTAPEKANHNFSVNVGNFSIQQSPELKQLPVIFDHIGALVVRDNKQLETVSLDRRRWQRYNESRNYEIYDPLPNNINNIDYVKGRFSIVEFTNNPKLKMRAAKDFDWKAKDDMQPVWVWPSWEMQSMVFNGNFSNDFFAPLIELKKQTKADWEKKKEDKNDAMPGRVIQKFVVNSDMGKKFDCSGLIGLKKDGFFPGEFSCQGESAAGMLKSSTAMVVSCAVLVGFVLL